MYEPRDGSGTLFQNDKGDNPARPDYRGDFMLDGQMYEMAGWKKQGQKGPYLSLAIKPKEQRETPAGGTPPSGGGGYGDLDDSIPFGPEVR